MRLSNIQGLEIADATIVGTYAPGNECNVRAGLKSREMLMLVRDVALRGLVGMDVVEAANTLNPTNVSHLDRARSYHHGRSDLHARSKR